MLLTAVAALTLVAVIAIVARVRLRRSRDTVSQALLARLRTSNQ